MRYLTYLFPFVLLFFTACGGGSTDKKQQANKPNSQAATQKSAKKSNDTRTIHIIGVDQMKYVVKEEGKMIGTGKKIKAQGKSYILLESIDAKAGKKLHVKLTTKSNMPASNMSHNWILLKNNADPKAFSSAATTAKDNDYIPSDKTSQIIAHTDLASGGETVEVTFTVPEKTGEYDYLCSFPAHYAAGMKGILNVK